jgi:hypothetical protein
LPDFIDKSEHFIVHCDSPKSDTRIRRE